MIDAVIPGDLSRAGWSPARTDPAIRNDGKCARHGCKRALPTAARNDPDPFCSNDCCRVYHNNPMPEYRGGVTFEGKAGRRRGVRAT